MKTAMRNASSSLSRRSSRATYAYIRPTGIVTSACERDCSAVRTLVSAPVERRQLTFNETSQHSQLRIEYCLNLPKIISKCCELVKLCHIYCSGPVFFATQCIIAIDVQSYTFHCCR